MCTCVVAQADDYVDALQRQLAGGSTEIPKAALEAEIAATQLEQEAAAREDAEEEEEDEEDEEDEEEERPASTDRTESKEGKQAVSDGESKTADSGGASSSSGKGDEDEDDEDDDDDLGADEIAEAMADIAGLAQEQEEVAQEENLSLEGECECASLTDSIPRTAVVVRFVLRGAEVGGGGISLPSAVLAATTAVDGRCFETLASLFHTPHADDAAGGWEIDPESAVAFMAEEPAEVRWWWC
jgi:hypothetical protein